jgi:hypothetical protein
VTRAALIALLTAACWAAGTGPAQAAPGLETGFADDRVLLEHPDQGPAAVAGWKALGVDVVRIHARWVAYAPEKDSPTVPAGFDARDPEDPGYDWKPLDRAVLLVRSAGIRVMLAVTGSGPLWGSQEPALGNPRLRPDPARFAAFATAVAKRYGWLVDRYLIWNEPNQPGWLQPQFACDSARPPRCRPASPGIYRSLVRAAYPAIKAADPGAEVLVGTLAPRGKPGTKENVPMSPLTFVRAFGCVDRRLRAVRSGPCRGFTTIPADGFSYHPHGVLRGPDEPTADPDDVAIADLPTLERTLDALTATGAFARRLDLYLTEFGYQTDPPDPVQGVAPDVQARWLAQSTYIAWRDPRVRTITQYAWKDEPVDDRGVGSKRYAKWQSGLLFDDGRPKPALAVFGLPLYADVERRVLWGMVRPDGYTSVSVTRRVTGARRFTKLGVARLAADGSFALPLPDARGATYRAVAG